MTALLRAAALVLAMAGMSAAAEPARAVLVCVAAGAPPELRQAAAALVQDAARVPLLRALAATQHAGAAEPQDSAALLGEKEWRRAAFAHLVVIGLPGQDPLLDRVWGFTARIETGTRRVHAQGYGDLQGDLGWIESERNPFLHSQRIERNGFDTCVVKLSGTSAAGVLAAVQAFRAGMLNGLVPVGTPTRVHATLLDLDPLPEPPPVQPAQLGSAQFGGWTQCAAEEYRAFIDAGGAEPRRLWRLRYLAPGAWDAIGARGWLAGPHRLAFGGAVTVAEFADAATAARTAAAIGKAGKPAAIAGQAGWELAPAKDEAIDPGDARPVLVAAQGALLVMTTLDARQAGAFIAALGR
jgi:hypothetical protein